MERGELRDDLYNAVIEFMRDEHSGMIDEAYEFFWEEEYPEDFLSGTALELGFINFEDWLVCDYAPKEGAGAIDMYMEKNRAEGERREMLLAMKGSFICLYEALPAQGGLGLRDLVLGGETTVENDLPHLKEGNVFAARLVPFGGGQVFGRCVYPFTKELTGEITAALIKNFDRYKKHKAPGGDLRRFLKDESYLFNTIWVSNLFRRKAK